VTMAKALAQDTPLLLLDEATSAMDIHRKLRFRNPRTAEPREPTDGTGRIARCESRRPLLRPHDFSQRKENWPPDGPTLSLLVPEILEELYQTRVQVHEVAGTGKRQVIFLP